MIFDFEKKSIAPLMYGYFKYEWPSLWSIETTNDMDLIGVIYEYSSVD